MDMSFTISPVTQTADVDVNRESIKEMDIPTALAAGLYSNTAPTEITAKNPRISTR